MMENEIQRINFAKCDFETRRFGIRKENNSMLSKYKLNQLYFKDTQFANLMTRRIFNVLLIANPYDAFMLEDDGRIDEKIFNEIGRASCRERV